MRSVFNWEDQLLQISYNHGELEYYYHDISEELDKEAKLEELQVKDRSKGFDLSKPTQLRLHIIKQSQEHYTIIKSEHHIISDGWSEPILLNQVHSYYKQLCREEEVLLVKDESYLLSQSYIQSHQSDVRRYWEKEI